MKRKLLIEGMSCGHCINHLKTALTEDIKGIEIIEVNLEDKYAFIDIKDEVTEEAIKVVIDDLGFKLKAIE